MMSYKEMKSSFESEHCAIFGGMGWKRLPFHNFDHLSRVSHLDLSHNELSELPIELVFGLPLLEYLDVGRNRLASLPDNVGDWTRLTFLNAGSNWIESLPVSMGKLNALAYLNLEWNPLTMTEAFLKLYGKREGWSVEDCRKMAKSIVTLSAQIPTAIVETHKTIQYYEENGLPTSPPEKITQQRSWTRQPSFVVNPKKKIITSDEKTVSTLQKNVVVPTPEEETGSKFIKTIDLCPNNLPKVPRHPFRIVPQSSKQPHPHTKVFGPSVTKTPTSVVERVVPKVTARKPTPLPSCAKGRSGYARPKHTLVPTLSNSRTRVIQPIRSLMRILEESKEDLEAQEENSSSEPSLSQSEAKIEDESLSSILYTGSETKNESTLSVASNDIENKIDSVWLVANNKSEIKIASAPTLSHAGDEKENKSVYSHSQPELNTKNESVTLLYSTKETKNASLSSIEAEPNKVTSFSEATAKVDSEKILSLTGIEGKFDNELVSSVSEVDADAKNEFIMQHISIEEIENESLLSIEAESKNELVYTFSEVGAEAEIETVLSVSGIEDEIGNELVSSVVETKAGTKNESVMLLFRIEEESESVSSTEDEAELVTSLSKTENIETVLSYSSIDVNLVNEMVSSVSKVEANDKNESLMLLFSTGKIANESLPNIESEPKNESESKNELVYSFLKPETIMSFSSTDNKIKNKSLSSVSNATVVTLHSTNFSISDTWNSLSDSSSEYSAKDSDVEEVEEQISMSTLRCQSELMTQLVRPYYVDDPLRKTMSVYEFPKDVKVNRNKDNYRLTTLQPSKSALEKASEDVCGGNLPKCNSDTHRKSKSIFIQILLAFLNFFIGFSKFGIIGSCAFFGTASLSAIFFDKILMKSFFEYPLIMTATPNWLKVLYLRYHAFLLVHLGMLCIYIPLYHGTPPLAWYEVLSQFFRGGLVYIYNAANFLYDLVL